MKYKSLAEVEDATGRVDVLLYKIAERLATHAEVKYGLEGLTQELMPTIEDQILEYVGSEKILEIPPAARVLLRKLGVRE